MSRMEEGTGHTQTEHPAISDPLHEVMRFVVKSKISWLCMYNPQNLGNESQRRARESITIEAKTSQFIAIRRIGKEN